MNERLPIVDRRMIGTEMPFKMVSGVGQRNRILGGCVHDAIWQMWLNGVCGGCDCESAPGVAMRPVSESLLATLLEFLIYMVGDGE